MLGGSRVMLATHGRSSAKRQEHPDDSGHDAHQRRQASRLPPVGYVHDQVHFSPDRRTDQVPPMWSSLDRQVPYAACSGRGLEPGKVGKRRARSSRPGVAAALPGDAGNAGMGVELDGLRIDGSSVVSGPSLAWLSRTTTMSAAYFTKRRRYSQPPGSEPVRIGRPSIGHGTRDPGDAAGRNGACTPTAGTSDLYRRAKGGE